jgi:hypothetical protein
MYVEMANGTIRGYPVSSINQIYFAGGVTNVHDQELMQRVLSSFTVSQNYPNPFNPTTTIQYNLPKQGDVEVTIYDIQGRLVRSLFASKQDAGTHSLVWDSQGDAGSTAASGTYFCQVLFNGSALVKKIILLK